MKRLFYEGGPQFMGTLTILLIITTGWIIYYFIRAYQSEKANTEKQLLKMGQGRLWGLFAMVTGFLGQLIGLTAMFDAIGQAYARGEEIKPLLVFGGIKVTMIVTMYGVAIFLLSILLWFIASSIIEKKAAS